MHVGLRCFRFCVSYQVGSCFTFADKKSSTEKIVDKKAPAVEEEAEEKSDVKDEQVSPEAPGVERGNSQNTKSQHFFCFVFFVFFARFRVTFVHLLCRVMFMYIYMNVMYGSNFCTNFLFSI